ncbi:MAG TPA: RDD family protein [Chitinophagaceae bacterium]|nr:RDD family protein [Chitinophagaceae bacterium]
MKNKRNIAVVLTGAALATNLYLVVHNVYEMVKARAPFFPASNIGLTVNMLVTFVGVGAFIQFVVEKFRVSRLLQVYLLFSFFSSGITLPLRLTLYALHLGVNAPFGYLLIQIILPVLYLYSARVFRKDRTPLYFITGTGENVVRQFFPVDKWLRLANRLLDAVLVYIILAIKAGWFIYAVNLLMGGRVFYWAPLELSVLAFFVLLLYYFVFESLFKTTLGKLVTNTRVVNETGERPGIGRVLGRTFCRLIPFEAWSFLFNDRGWHDSFSGTYVIKEKYEWEAHGIIA